MLRHHGGSLRTFARLKPGAFSLESNMHRSPNVIERAISAQRRTISEAQQRLAELERELNTARALELAGRRQQGRVAHVLERLETGEHIVSGQRAWWCRNGQLIERASGDDLEALFTLRQHGLIETIRR